MTVSYATTFDISRLTMAPVVLMVIAAVSIARIECHGELARNLSFN